MITNSSSSPDTTGYAYLAWIKGARASARARMHCASSDIKLDFWELLAPFHIVRDAVAANITPSSRGHAYDSVSAMHDPLTVLHTLGHILIPLRPAKIEYR